MPVETASYVSDLNASNPAHSDGLNQADAHLRMIKAALKATLGSTTGQLVNDNGQLIPGPGTAAHPAYSFAAEPTLGFYRSAAGTIRVAGGKLANGVSTGAVQMFIAEPASIGKATADTGKDWLELNGASYNVTDYPDLAAFLGVSSGTFTLPDMYSTGRFPRSRTAAIAVRSAQANTVGPHTHPDVTATTAAETQEHTHGFSGTTGNDSPDHTHSSGSGLLVASSASSSTGGGAFGFQYPNSFGGSTSGASARHQHAFSGTTSGRSATHNHTVVVSTPANTGTTETRPEAMAFVFAVKT